MGLVRGLLFLLAAVAFSDAADYQTEEPSISLNYGTVTEIIEALSSEDEPAEEEPEEGQDSEFVMQVTQSPDVVYEYVYEQHPDAFEKRLGLSARKRKPQKHRVYYQIVTEPEEEEPEEPCEVPSEKEEPCEVPSEKEEPCEVPSEKEEPCEVPSEKEEPCEVPSEKEEPCEVPSEKEEPVTEILTAEESYGFVGSLKGVPGVDYPNYKEIPLTSFTCSGKYIPGFYADLETNCQVFHVCYPHRRESFLCPIGTTFNQPILACDYWYNSNCSKSPDYYDKPVPSSDELEEPESIEVDSGVLSIVDEFPSEEESTEQITQQDIETEFVKPTVPVDIQEPITFSEVTEPPVQEIIQKPVFEVLSPKPTAPEIKPVLVEIPPPKLLQSKPPVKPDLSGLTSVKFLPVKTKVTKFTVPLAATGKVKVGGATAKVKMVSAKKVPFKVAKAKIVAAPIKAVPVAKMVKAAPVLKKAVANKLKLKKAKMVAPILKPVLFKKAVKANKAALAKAKIGKVLVKKAAVPVSVLTKKHLALSLSKMLKAKKLGMLGAHPLPLYYP